ncbi:MAG: hypothetical protein KAJ51_07320, partial [Thermoplasmata archaeon]|nr:hypothetical protein [Thermoplasmata archaeon]
MENLVWYACYGSNLFKKRFLLYIEGGRADIVPKTYIGCTDKTPPHQDKSYIIHYELYFAKSSEIWEGKGVAFIKSQVDSTIKTLARLYLITKQQFGEVFLQENDLDPRSNSIELDLSQIKAEGELKL